jgi:hypothetical protein
MAGAAGTKPSRTSRGDSIMPITIQLVYFISELLSENDRRASLIGPPDFA